MWLESSECVNMFVDNDTRPIWHNSTSVHHFIETTPEKHHFLLTQKLVLDLTEPHTSLERSQAANSWRPAWQISVYSLNPAAVFPERQSYTCNPCYEAKPSSPVQPLLY